MNDIERQVNLVVDSVGRILSQIDTDPLSPTFGCAHLAYWRDKTSDVADTRMQEVIFPLALLYTGAGAHSPWKSNERLLETIVMLMKFWSRNQYRDGSFDEWYKGERAFAAASFSTHAAARTLCVMDGVLPEEVVMLARNALRKAADWLARRNDLFKTNHQAVGVAALAWAAEALGEQKYHDHARRKLASIIRIQTAEGWFPEVGHMDIGYTYLTAEFAAMAMEVMDDWTHVDHFRRAFDFACDWTHPDLGIGEEYGVCHNQYVSRIAAILLAPYSGRAEYLRRRFTIDDGGPPVRSSFPEDDLRLFRWAFQPLLAKIYLEKRACSASYPEEPIPLASGISGYHVCADSGLARLSRDGMHVVVAGCAGGVTRLMNKAGECVSEFGYAVSTGKGFATNLTYDRRIEFLGQGQPITIKCHVSPVRKFMPPFWARVILRLACSTALTSRITRKLIDLLRRSKSTAVNQSSANLSSRSKWSLRRSVSIDGGDVTIKDDISFDSNIHISSLFFLHSSNYGTVKMQPLATFYDGSRTEGSMFSIRRVFMAEQGRWILGGTSVDCKARAGHEQPK